MNAALCDVLSLKYDLGARTRKAYAEGNKDALKAISEDYALTVKKLEIFHEKFSYLWSKENKPHGFEVQDLRIGGLIMRLNSCKKRIDTYIAGDISTIEELNDNILDWFGGVENYDQSNYPVRNQWSYIASPSVI